MNLKILLPFQVFVEKKQLSRIVAETQAGSFGILPQRLDCVAALVPGILSYENQAEGEVFIAIDEGILVKTGSEVVISVRNAAGGRNLEELYQIVETEFLNLNAREQSIRSVMAKIESNFIRHLAKFHHD